MEFGILGPVRVCRPEGPVRLSGKQRAVISVFLLHPNTPISRDRLIASLWDDPPRSAPANIQTYVHQLRRALSGTALRVRTEGSGYTCELPPDQLDLLAFDQAVRRGRQERARGDLAAAEREYAAAMALWRGTPAQDVPLGSAMTARLAELEERFEVARSEWIDLRLALGGDDLVAELRTLVAGHPLRERLWEQLMTALYAGGRRDEALATFREARALLVAELGVEPGRELTRLHAAILAGTPLQEPDRPLPRRTLCRLPADTADFVGRTAELEALLPVMRAREDRLGPPIAVVSGLPGVGKTAFAVHLAHLLRPDYPDGQLFVHLGRHRGPAELLGELLRCLGVDGTLVPGPVEERAGMLRQRLADLAVLIVLDDADDETQVRHLLPGTARGAVLVTSRSSLPALEGATRLPLGLPSESEARQLLERVAGRDRIGAAPRAAEEILRTCGTGRHIA
ncbi:MAG: transcriptional regulator, partial [Nonomuraea sp.]|nr:transcriptional regulator [Nonomuraea sp.]